MKFSEIQKKEVIDASKGSFLGYVQDASIDIKNGKVKTLHVSGGDKGMFFGSSKNEISQIRMSDITVIGKDIVLVAKSE